MKQVDLKEAQARLSELVKRAVDGEEIVIFEENRPLAKLVSVAPLSGRRQFGSARGLIKMSDDFDEPLEDFREYM